MTTSRRVAAALACAVALLLGFGAPAERAQGAVIEFQLAPAQVLVPSLEGYGTQYNHHVYAAISRQVGVTEENVQEMESKVIALEPAFIRVYFHHSAFTDPDRMQSFVRTVQLAQQSGTTINVTWQGGGQLDPDGNMSKFANVLIDLVKNKGITKLRWVTIHNEVNSTLITMEENEAMYRALDPHLRNAGVRDQIRFMGGDLVGTVSPLGETQEEWFQYLATKMADILDAYSVHIFWDYWDTAKLVRRLQEVRAIVDGLPASGRKPLYNTEFSVRGIRNLNGVSYPAPGIYADGTPMAQTNISAFQHAWFNVLAAKLGYYGTVKWDAYFGKYDSGTQAHYMIGPPQEGWPLRPVYHLTRLLTLTTKPGWKVVGVDGTSGSKLLSAYASPEGRLTVVGLDTAGAQLNTVSATQVSYSIGGLPPNSPFQLYYWNQDGSGQNSLAGVVTSDAAGVLNVSAPLHSVFAVTTLTTQAPAPTVTTASLADGTLGQAYSQTLQASGGTAPYTWTLAAGTLPPGLALNGETGEISGTPTATGTFSFTARVTDSAAPGQSSEKALSIAVGTAVAITTTSPPNGTVGEPYAQTLQASGGTTPYTWSIATDSLPLPPGLSLDPSTGTIAGTPTSAGSFAFTVQVTDSATPARTATQPLSITIAPAPLAITTTSLPNGRVNKRYSQTLQASGGTSPYAWSIVAGVLPPGLSLDPSTGTIAGKPNLVGTYSFTAQAADSAAPAQKAVKALSITIRR